MLAHVLTCEQCSSLALMLLRQELRAGGTSKGGWKSSGAKPVWKATTAYSRRKRDRSPEYAFVTLEGGHDAKDLCKGTHLHDNHRIMLDFAEICFFCCLVFGGRSCKHTKHP